MHIPKKDGDHQDIGIEILHIVLHVVVSLVEDGYGITDAEQVINVDIEVIIV
jgi:hypothetical protein